MKIFDMVQGIKPKLNKFDLSYENKLTCNMGNLIPIFTHEVLPGDHWRVNSQTMLRMLALVAPVMHRVDVYVHYFFTPNRLLWSEWEDFITGGEDGTSAPVPPYFDLNPIGRTTSIGASSLTDYLGLPVASLRNGDFGDRFEVSALPFRAYQLIYDQYYRDQNYIDSILHDGWKNSGSDYTVAELDNFLTLQKRAWEHDYFTSILPFLQRGGDVTMGVSEGNLKFGPHIQTRDASGAIYPGGAAGTANTVKAETLSGIDSLLVGDNGTTKTGLTLEGNAELDVNITVNSLRDSISLQGFLEAMARFGSRYVEYLRGIFGTNPRDSRLQRAEYLGGGMQQVVISEVLQTGQPTAESDLPQGNMAGHGISFGRTNGFNRMFDEHGIVMGIMSILPKTQYSTNMDRMWTRKTRLDYYQPHLAHLGEQAVYQYELQLVNGNGFDPFSGLDHSGNDNFNTLGYNSRFSEYKYIPGQTHGQFNSTLSFWTLGRLFDGSAATPINRAFIECTPREDIFAVEGDTDHIVCQIFHEVSCLRPIPLFSTPSLLFPAHA